MEYGLIIKMKKLQILERHNIEFYFYDPEDLLSRYHCDEDEIEIEIDFDTVEELEKAKRILSK